MLRRVGAKLLGCARATLAPSTRWTSAVPLELRKIQFSLDEIRAAVLAHCRATGRPMPQTPVTDIVISNHADTTVVLRFASGARMPEPGEVAIGREDTVAALIQYCLDLRIPLPRAGKKVLWHVDDTLALMITLNVDTDTDGREKRAVRSTVVGRGKAITEA